MYINFTPHKANVNNSNASSCANIFEYLEKEEQGFIQNGQILRDENKESIGFFDQQNINIPKEEVIENIDNNRGKRGIKESNFYMINISPSYLEQKHLLKSIDQFLEEKMQKEKIKLSDKELANTRDIVMRDLLMNYSREVMKEYAKNFNREINGEKITDENLLYYGRVETQRTYNFKDRQVRENKKILKQIEHIKDASRLNELKDSLHRDYFTGEIIKEGGVKGGVNYHVHIVVSRHDKTNHARHKISLSPMSKYREQKSQLNNQKNKTIGFNRDAFFQSAEKTFDELFNYNRDYSKSYEAMKKNANTKGVRENLKRGIVKNVKKELSKYTGISLSKPSYILKTLS